MKVLAFEREIEAAVVRGDVALVDAASASTFTFTHGDGWTTGGAPLRVDSRADWMATVAKAPYASRCTALGEDRGAWRYRNNLRALRRPLQTGSTRTQAVHGLVPARLREARRKMASTSRTARLTAPYTRKTDCGRREFVMTSSRRPFSSMLLLALFWRPLNEGRSDDSDPNRRRHADRSADIPSCQPGAGDRRLGPEPRLETFTQWLAASRTAREGALQPCVDRIRSLDGDIKAWVQVLPQSPTGTGTLSGVPFGVKDIIETKGLATEYGSAIYRGRIGTADAAIVSQLRQRGGVLLGKTHTTAFAYTTPSPTHNPRNLSHTPGGSSSGSAAAVAAGMVPVAIGTQTGGSVIRPASFCGVTGFKTSYGLLPMDGVFPFAKSLDTLGFFTHTAADMLAFWEAMGHLTGRPEDFPLAAPDPVPGVEPPMAKAFGDALVRLRGAGVAIRSVDITPMLARLRDAQRTVMFYEGARFHEERYKQYGDRLADTATLVRDGLQIPMDRYGEARGTSRRARRGCPSCSRPRR